jgi:hypothetical protein
LFRGREYEVWLRERSGTLTASSLCDEAASPVK